MNFNVFLVGNDLFLVSIHELGHALGLAHSTNPSSIMYETYQHHNTKPFKMPLDDILGIRAIYGRKPKPTTPVISSTTATVTTIVNVTTTVATTVATTVKNYIDYKKIICELDVREGIHILDKFFDNFLR